MEIRTWSSMVIECADRTEYESVTNFLVAHFPNVDINVMDEVGDEPYITIEYQDQRTIDAIIETLGEELP